MAQGEVPTFYSAMARPEEVAYNDKDVKMPARLLYFGIQPTHGAYVSPNGYSNLSPWPMYRLIGSSVVKEERGIAYFLTVQVPARQRTRSTALALSLPTLHRVSGQ